MKIVWYNIDKWEVVIVNRFINIDSNLDSLKLKSMEKHLYENIGEDEFIIPKAIPFKGINTDMLLIKDNRILFIKFMDTSEELFYVLDEEIIEIMNEEHNQLVENMKKNYPRINFNYVFVMPYIDSIEYKYDRDEFVDSHIIFGESARDALLSFDSMGEYFSQENDEVLLTMFISKVCTEYFAFTKGLNLSRNLKKLSFSDSNLDYKIAMMDEEQIVDVSSVNYGNHLIQGGSGTGKSTIMLGRVIKLSKIYPHHKFLLLTYTKHQYVKYKEQLELLQVDSDNIEVHTLSSFVFKLAKIYGLVIDYNLFKRNYDKAFSNIMKQIKNSIKNKRVFKGIFVDEGENFTEEEIELVYEFLYKTKRIFNVNFCKAYNINNNLNIFKCRLKVLDFEDEKLLVKNYRQSKEIVEFINKYCENTNNFIADIRGNLATDVFTKTSPVWSSSKKVNIVRVDDLDDQINSIVWEVQHLVNDLGYSYNDIAIIFPYNKKKLKNGKIIYFQYMLRKSLEDANIEYILPDEDITDITIKRGVTISNIYSVKTLSFKAVVVCELEMLYNHYVDFDKHDYQVNDFVGDLNKVYTAMTRAEESLSLIVSYTPETSHIIKLIHSSELDLK